MGFSAPNAISYQEIAAWAALTARKPNPWEVRLLRLIDNAILARLSERSEHPDGIKEIEVDDVEGLTSLLSVLRTRQNAGSS